MEDFSGSGVGSDCQGSVAHKPIRTEPMEVLEPVRLVVTREMGLSFYS